MESGAMKYAAVVMSIAVLLSICMGTASAETLEIDKNECIYMPEINKDYCQSEYLIYDETLNLSLISLIYADFTENNETRMSDGEFYAELPGLDTEYKFTEMDTNTYRVELEGYKSPLLDIDHVLCYDGNCHYEWAWWNASFGFKNPVFGNASVNIDTSVFVPINISMNGELQIIWCNWTLNATNRTIGYVYWNDNTDYVCVNDIETSTVPMNVEEGGDTGYGEIDPDLLIWYHANDTATQESIYNITLSNSGCSRDTDGNIGASIRCDRATTDYLDFLDDPLFDTISSLNLYSWCAWMNTSAFNVGVAPEQFINNENVTYPFMFRRFTADTKISWFINTDSGDEILTTINLPDINKYFHVCGTINSTIAKLFINGATVDTEDFDLGTITDWTGLRINCRLSPTDRCGNMEYDEFKLWNRSVTVNEVKAMFAAESPFFALGDTESINLTQITLTVFQPLAITYTSLTIPLAISANDTINHSWYFLNNDSIVFFTPNTTFTAINGSNTINIYINNSFGVQDNEIVNFTVNFEPVQPSEILTQFCSDDDTLYRIEKDTADDGSAVYNPVFESCLNGCSNSTITNWGAPGCIEDPLMLWIILLVSIILMALLFKGINR